MPEAKDMITEDNVYRTYNENNNICFELKNGFKVKLNPNKGSVKPAASKQGG